MTGDPRTFGVIPDDTLIRNTPLNLRWFSEHGCRGYYKVPTTATYAQ